MRALGAETGSVHPRTASTRSICPPLLKSRCLPCKTTLRTLPRDWPGLITTPRPNPYRLRGRKPLVDEDSFALAQALLKQRGQDLTLRRGNRSEFLLSGVIRCGRCKRAYIGMSARGNGGFYHYYACSGRQKLGSRACDGERLNRDKLETAVLDQLARLYRDGELIAAALQTAHRKSIADRPAIEEQRRTLSEEIRRGERALDRYYQAFENGELDAGRFQARLTELEGRLESLHEHDASLTSQFGADDNAHFDPASLATVAHRLRDTLAAGEPEQTKALLRLLIKELRVNGRSEILPTYRVVTPEVCAQRQVQWSVPGSNR
jgi:site-specific DNA recombinase